MPLFTDKKNSNPFIQPCQFTEEELPIASKIQQRRLQMLIHSRLYYKLDTSIIPDQQFDLWGRELVRLQEQHPNIAKRICYAKAFDGWDGNTGAFLPLEDDWVVDKVDHLLYIREVGTVIEVDKTTIEQAYAERDSSEEITGDDIIQEVLNYANQHKEILGSAGKSSSESNKRKESPKQRRNDVPERRRLF